MNNKILINLIKNLSDDDIYSILINLTYYLEQRGFDLYDILCTINDEVKKKGV